MISQRCLTLLLSAAAIVASGCQDADAKRRAEVQAVIATASRDLWLTSDMYSNPVAENIADEQKRLTRLISDLSDTGGADPGQEAAAARLAATAHRKLAALAKAQADQLEADHRTRRQLLHSLIDKTGRLQTLADGLESIDIDTEQSSLARQRSDTQAQLSERSREMADLDGPIADLQRQNRQDQNEVERLHVEANRLRREASDVGPALGFDGYQHAVQLDRQADQIELQIAQRETELRYDLEPRQKMASKRIEQLRTRINTIDDAVSSLESLTSMTRQEAASTRQQVDEARQDIDDALRELSESAAGPLKELCDQAAAELDRAASKARSATRSGSRELVDAARAEAARAQLDLGHLHWSLARGLEGQIILLQRVKAIPGSLGLRAVDQELSAARAAHQTAVDAAKAAFTGAQELLNQVRGPTAQRELVRLKGTVSLALSAVSGETIDLSENAATE